MYTLTTTATGVKRGLNKRWADIDLDTISVQDLIADYRIVQITLTPQDAEEPVYLLLSDIASDYTSFVGTFQDLLDELGDDALPTTDDPIIRAKQVARYYDVFKLRYQIKVVDATNAEPVTAFDEDDYDHIRLERGDALIDPITAPKQVLVNINGFYHRGENVQNKGLFVRDGFKSLRLSQQNQLALWDFQELDNFTLLPTIPGQVHTSGNAFQVNFSQSLTGKTVFFVVAGYPFFVDGDVVTQNGANNFLIDFAHVSMRLAARYFEAANYIDLSSIAALAEGETPGSIDVTLLDSPAVIAAWIALTQSFAVIVNHSDCYVESKFVKRTNNPSQYLCYLDRDPSNVANEIDNPRLSLMPPDLPLVLELGHHPPYWVTTEGWVHSLTIYSNRVGQLLYESGQPAQNILTSGADQPGSPGLCQHAYLLEFGSDVA